MEIFSPLHNWHHGTTTQWDQFTAVGTGSGNTQVLLPLCVPRSGKHQLYCSEMILILHSSLVNSFDDTYNI